MSNSYKGECLCGAIKYEIDAFGPRLAHCHCSMCRKFHGAPCVTLGEVNRSNFRWIQGEEALQSYVAENGTIRRFCRYCGSSLTFSSPNTSEDIVEISLGTLDSDLNAKPDAHIYVGSKANWTVICDNLPQYEASRQSNRLK